MKNSKLIEAVANAGFDKGNGSPAVNLDEAIHIIRQHESKGVDKAALRELIITAMTDYEQYVHTGRGKPETVYVEGEADFIITALRPYLRTPEQPQESLPAIMDVVVGNVDSVWVGPTLETISRWRLHSAITRRDWVGVLAMLEGFLRLHAAQPDKDVGLTEDLSQLIRVALTNPADLRGFIQANYPKEYAEQVTAQPDTATEPQNHAHVAETCPHPDVVGGYAPGDYFCRCIGCGAEFTGDKRAVQCLSCATVTHSDRVNAFREMKALVIGADPAGKAGDNTAVVLRIGSERHILRQPFAGAFIELAERPAPAQPDTAEVPTLTQVWPGGEKEVDDFKAGKWQPDKAEVVERLTHVVLKEARENGADSPVDYGDAEQIVNAILSALPPQRDDSGLVEAEQPVESCGFCNAYPHHWNCIHVAQRPEREVVAVPEGRKSEYGCDKCGKHEVYVKEINERPDYRITCHGCGHSYCVDGSDL